MGVSLGWVVAFYLPLHHPQSPFVCCGLRPLPGSQQEGGLWAGLWSQVPCWTLERFI